MNIAHSSLTIAISLMIYINSSIATILQCLPKHQHDGITTNDYLKKSYFDFGLIYTKTTFNMFPHCTIVSPISIALILDYLRTGINETQIIDEIFHFKKPIDPHSSSTLLSVIQELKCFPGTEKFSIILNTQDNKFQLTRTLKNIIRLQYFNVYIKKSKYSQFPSNTGFIQLLTFNISVIHNFRARPLKPFTKYVRDVYLPHKLSATKRNKDQILLYQRNGFRYGENSKLDAKWIEIPLESIHAYYAISMIVVVPNKVNRLDKIIKQIQNIRSFFPTDTKERPVELWIPEFHIQEEYSSFSTLQQLGLKTSTFDFEKWFVGKPKSLVDIYQTINLTFVGTETTNNSDTRVNYYYPLNLSFREQHDTFIVDGSFVGFIISQNMIHFCFKVEGNENVTEKLYYRR